MSFGILKMVALDGDGFILASWGVNGLVECNVDGDFFCVGQRLCFDGGVVGGFGLRVFLLWVLDKVLGL